MANVNKVGRAGIMSIEGNAGFEKERRLYWLE